MLRPGLLKTPSSHSALGAFLSWIATVVVVVAAVLAAGCGDDDGDAKPAPPPTGQSSDDNGLSGEGRIVSLFYGSVKGIYVHMEYDFFHIPKTLNII